MEYRIAINEEPDITRAVMQARRCAEDAGFDAAQVSMLATVASELARNIVKYAGSGELIVRPIDVDGGAGLEIVARDQGPGIADVERALEDHFSSSGTLGLGLPGVKRLMDELQIESGPSGGAVVTARKRL